MSPSLDLVEKFDGLFQTGGGEKAASELDVPFVGRVPFEPQIVEVADVGMTFIQEDPDSEAGQAFAQIVAEVINLVSTEKSPIGG
jgi:nitrogenase subunit NifH